MLRKPANAEKIRRSYEKQFAAEKPGQIRGEGSTAYSGWANWPSDPTESNVVAPIDPATAAETMMREIDETARRMAEISPKARLIYLLRHPVDRIYSQVRFNTRYAPVPVDVNAALDVDPRYIQTSHYADIIRIYLSHFSREQLFVARLDEMARDLPGFLDRVQDFLGIPRDPAILQAEVFTNESKDLEGRRALAQRLQRIPGLALVGRMAPERLRRRVFGVLRNSPLTQPAAKAAPMSAAVRSRLLEHFAKPNRELQELTGLDVSDWSK